MSAITRRIDAITAIPASHLREAPPAPKSVKIEVSGRCNYACRFCSLRTRDAQPTHDMDFELFKRITTEMRAADVEEIGVFYLGESLTNPMLTVACVEFCKRELAMPYVFLTSNASLATAEVVSALMQAGLDSLKWSINAADAGQFLEVMAVKPRLFHNALANIKRAYQIREAGGYKTGLYASSIRYDGEQQTRMEALLAREVLPYVDEHYWLPLYSMAMRSHEIQGKLGYIPTHGNSGRWNPETGLPTRDPLPCWSVFTEGHVRVDGHLSACCFGSDERFDVGDLTRQPFMQAWASPAMRAIRAAQIRTLKEGPRALAGTMCEVCVAYSSAEA
jgi:hypothetical protein